MEILERAEALLKMGDEYMEEKNIAKAFLRYIDALYAAGAVFAYKETGMLMSSEELMGFLESRFPEVHSVIVRCENMPESQARAVREEAEKLIGMAREYWEVKG